MVAYLERALHGIAGRKPEKLEVARKVLGRHGWGAALATADNLSLGEDDSDDWPTFALWTAALDCGHEDAWRHADEPSLQDTLSEWVSENRLESHLGFARIKPYLARLAGAPPFGDCAEYERLRADLARRDEEEGDGVAGEFQEPVESREADDVDEGPDEADLARVRIILERWIEPDHRPMVAKLMQANPGRTIAWLDRVADRTGQPDWDASWLMRLPDEVVARFAEPELATG